MPRKNRFTVKTPRRRQRSKTFRPLAVLDDGWLMRLRNERGSHTPWVATLVIMIGSVLVVLAFIVGATCSRADARAVNLEPAVTHQGRGPSPVLYVEHVQYRWFYVEFANGASWMVTRCRHEDSNNCWWDAEKRGNGGGVSFVVIKQHYHKAVRGTVVR